MLFVCDLLWLCLASCVHLALGPGAAGYKRATALKTSQWKRAKKLRERSSLLGHLTLESYQEVAAMPPQLQELATKRADAYLEIYFFQEALAQPFGQPPLGHAAEFCHRVKAALELEKSISWEEYRVSCYELAFLHEGVRTIPGGECLPKWAPDRVLQLMKSMGPKIRTAD